MNASATIADPLLRRAFGQRARPSDPQRTARVRIGSSRLRALVSRRGSAISRRTVMNNEGLNAYVELATYLVGVSRSERMNAKRFPLRRNTQFPIKRQKHYR